MLRMIPGNIFGYIKIKRIKPPNCAIDHKEYLFSLGISNISECEYFYKEYNNNYIIFDQVKQVFINNAGEMQVNCTDYYLIIGKDRRTIYTPYHNIMVKVGKIIEWRKTPFESNDKNESHNIPFLTYGIYLKG